MAKFSMKLPTELMAQMQKLEGSADDIFGEMTRAGAEAVKNAISANVPQSIRDSAMMDCLLVTVTYKTPSDGGINTKVGFYGYFKNKNGQTESAPLVANVFEYGRSGSPFPKQPFMRKSFNRGMITAAMLAAMRRASGGLLE